MVINVLTLLLLVCRHTLWRHSQPQRLLTLYTQSNYWLNWWSLCNTSAATNHGLMWRQVLLGKLSTISIWRSPSHCKCLLTLLSPVSRLVAAVTPGVQPLHLAHGGKVDHARKRAVLVILPSLNQPQLMIPGFLNFILAVIWTTSYTLAHLFSTNNAISEKLGKRLVLFFI